jgi:chromosome partitioning protein
MSTNLGWPSEPEPGPEHRRLGWLARMLGVSRETGDGQQAESGPETSGDETQAANAAEVGGSGTGEVVDTPSQADAASGTHDVAGTTDESSVDESSVDESSVDESSVDESSADTEPRDDIASDDRAGEPDPETVEAHVEPTPSDTEAPGAQPDPLELGHDLSASDESLPSPDQPLTDEAAAFGERQVIEPAPGAAPDDRPVEDSGPAPVEVEAPGVEAAQDELPPPVDNAVDDAPGNASVEREITSNEAGDNAVDEARRASELRADHADREALAAAIPTAGQDTPLAMELAENARRRIQLTGRPFPKPVGPRVLTVANQKGGVGKTTTTVNVAAALAQSGLKALVIDLDPQGNASTALGIDHHAEVPSIYDVLVEGTPLLDVVQRCTTVENLYCAPATIDLAGAEIELVSLVARESRLQKAIAAAAEAGHEFDYILIDCPPSLGLLTVNAMVAASEVFIPIQCEYYALEGLSQLLKNIDLVKRHLNPALHVSTILLTMYDGRTRLSAQVADEVREHFPTEVLRTSVPRSVRVSEAPSFGETVMTYDPASSGALAYLEAAGEIADRGAAGRT